MGNINLSEELENSQMSVEIMAFEAVNSSDKVLNMMKNALENIEDEHSKELLSEIITEAALANVTVGELENCVDAHRGIVEQVKEYLKK